MRCIRCGTEIVTTRGIAYEVTGFEVDREQGGTNHVLFRQRTGKVMCQRCVTLEKAHIHPAQQQIA
jgi:hypothetical protein